MKRMLITVLIVTMTICISACGQATSNDDNSEEISELKEQIEKLKEENEELKADIEMLDSSSTNESLEVRSEKDNFVAETSGVCGTDLTWEYGNGILKVHGTGDMTDYGIYDGICSYPWGDIRMKVNIITIDDGCKYIGEFAFYDFVSLSKITIPSSVEEVRYTAFANAYELNTIQWGDDEYIIETRNKSTDEKRADLNTVIEKMNNDGHTIQGVAAVAPAVAP